MAANCPVRCWEAGTKPQSWDEHTKWAKTPAGLAKVNIRSKVGDANVASPRTPRGSPTILAAGLDTLRRNLRQSFSFSPKGSSTAASFNAAETQVDKGQTTAVTVAEGAFETLLKVKTTFVNTLQRAVLAGRAMLSPRAAPNQVATANTFAAPLRQKERSVAPVAATSGSMMELDIDTYTIIYKVPNKMLDWGAVGLPFFDMAGIDWQDEGLPYVTVGPVSWCGSGVPVQEDSCKEEQATVIVSTAETMLDFGLTESEVAWEGFDCAADWGAPGVEVMELAMPDFGEEGLPYFELGQVSWELVGVPL